MFISVLQWRFWPLIAYRDLDQIYALTSQAHNISQTNPSTYEEFVSAFYMCQQLWLVDM